MKPSGRASAAMVVHALAVSLVLLAGPLVAQSTAAFSGRPATGSGNCHAWAPEELDENPTEAELRCRWGITGAGRFGLLSYLDVPVYQPATPMPGTHLVGVHGHVGPRPGESYEGWEWRVLRTEYGRAARRIRRSHELLDPSVATIVIRFEKAIADAGIRAVRRETWRSPERQGYIFQQGRSRPGPLATTTLTSWHSQVDAAGRPAGRAVDYDVPRSQMVRFHEIARAMGLATFGADSNDPGHVFVPDPEPIAKMEVVMLRLLPAVPVVTLATGIPVDRALPRGGRSALRAAVRAFVDSAHVPVVAPRVAKRSAAAEIVGAPALSPAPAHASGSVSDAAPGSGVSGSRGSRDPG